ncbi:serine hydrolase [Streptomyces sp. NPDC059650]|uniref:serine hydrolase n=1 Tax=Streptomyces sp. NPDC059650 TaxID=3346896 RepID=UPI0036A78393
MEPDRHRRGGPEPGRLRGRGVRLTLLAAPGARPSYSQAAYDLAGRVVEKVRGMPFEKAGASLLLEPIGLSDTCFDLDDVVTRTYALGYNRGQDGALRVATPVEGVPGRLRERRPVPRHRHRRHPAHPRGPRQAGGPGGLGDGDAAGPRPRRDGSAARRRGRVRHHAVVGVDLAGRLFTRAPAPM